MYTLHSFPVSQHCRRVLALMDEAGLSYDVVPVALEKGEHRAPDYAKLNPAMQVPTLVSEELTLRESNAILRYLCAAHGLATWYPADAALRARVDEWLDWNQCRLGPHTIDIVLNTVFLGENGDKKAIQRGRDALPGHFAILEAGLADQPFLVGAEPTIADLSVASNVTHLKFADIEPEGPKTQAWLARVCAIPGFAAHLPQG